MNFSPARNQFLDQQDIERMKKDSIFSSNCFNSWLSNDFMISPFINFLDMIYLATRC